MNITVLIMSLVMALTLAVPFLVFKGVKFAKNKDYITHRKWQNWIFIISMLGLFGLEGLIQSSGGSGSIASQSSYYDTSYFKPILFAHILGAMLTYLLWTIQIIVSNISFKKSLPGKSGKMHKALGMITFLGLVYTAVTALIVYVLTLELI